MKQRAQTDTIVGTLMLVGGIAVGLLIFTLYLSTLAQERQTTVSGQLGMQESRTSYRNLFKVNDDFGNELGELLSAAVATSQSPAENRKWAERGRQPTKTITISGAPCKGGTGTDAAMYPGLCCGGTRTDETVTFAADANYVATYDITEYDLLRYVQCYLIPAKFYPIFGNNYKVTAKMGAKTIETGNTLYTEPGEKFYIAAVAGNPETLVEVTIAGEIKGTAES